MDDKVISLNTKSERKTAPIEAEPAAPASPDGAVGAPGAKGSGLVKKVLIGTVASIAVVASAYYGHDYWSVGRFEISTDDAYIKADSSAIAPKIAGYLSEVLVTDNQTIKSGQVLAKIEDSDFVTALEAAKADVAAAKATIDAKQAALDTQQSTIAAAKATLEIDQANEDFAKQNDARYSRLADNGYAAKQTAQQAASQIAAFRATTVRDTALLSGATTQLKLLEAEVAQARAALAKSRAAERQAELNLSYTKIVAPIDGAVGNRSLRVGQYVQAGTQLMSVVPTGDAYVIANYKETQLTDVKPGQQVDIDVDMFPGHIYHGRVESIAPASGQEFALLPPDNATGNFTKVVQRIPVRIVLDKASVASGDLRPGMSVQPSIDTKTSDN